MQIGIVGNLSGGKTALSLYLAKYRLKEYPEKKVISNIRTNFKSPVKNIYLNNENIIDFLKVNYQNEQVLKNMFQDSILILDEIGNLVMSRSSSSNLNSLILNFLMMVGKLDCDVIYTAQRLESQADILLREITSIIMNCYRIDDEGKPCIFDKRYPNKKILILVVMEVDLGLLGKKILKFIFNPEEVYSLYDSKEMNLLDRSKYMTGGVKDLRRW